MEAKQLQDITVLINRLKQAKLNEVGVILKEYNGAGWLKYAFYDNKCAYTRNLIHEEPGVFSLMLLCWNPGSASPCHDHNGSECFMRLLDGSLLETRHTSTAETTTVTATTHEMKNGDVLFINDRLGRHSMQNPSQTLTATSLHLYLPPYRTCRAWHHPTTNPTKCEITFYSVHGQKPSTQ